MSEIQQLRAGDAASVCDLPPAEEPLQVKQFG